MRVAAVFVACAAALLFACVASAQSGLVVSTTNGPVEGFMSEYDIGSCRAWRGIPYASPPNGTMRFQAPTLPQNWAGTLQAMQSGPGCPQVCTLPTGLCPPRTSEDCLYLNVFSPLVVTEPLPVMVFIHGGNFRQGEGSSSMYDPTIMVNSTEIVVVTINYRLGALGFFFQAGSTANNGLLDQQLALTWVQSNIAGFGGDPTAVTIFGQSAGATSVASHLQNTDSLKLFRSAILQSIPLGIPVRYPAEAEALNADFATDLACDIGDLACLQAADVTAVLAAQGKAAGALGPDWSHLLEIAQSWEPTLQMDSFPIPLALDRFFQSYGSTPAASVPVMMGTTSQEAYVFIYELVNSSMGWVAADALETAVFGLEDLGGLDVFYPVAAGQDNRVPMSEMGSDELFICPARNATDGILATGGNSVHLFVFDHLSADSVQGWGPNYQICWTKVCHGSDVPYVFNSAAPAGRNFTAAETALAGQMSLYWSNFAKSGDPNKGLGVAATWPSMTPHTRQTMIFSTTAGGVVENYHAAECDYLDTLGYEH